MKITKCGLLAVLCVPALSFAVEKYELTLTNGSGMPLSPLVAYTVNGSGAKSVIGSAPTKGFIALCQTGNPAVREGELKKEQNVPFVIKTDAPILPGQSKTLIVEVKNSKLESINVETMYGKSKDACGVISINPHSLEALRQHVSPVIFGKDNAVVTGAFTAPVVPEYGRSVCETSDDAVTCLREFSVANAGEKKIAFFTPYLPSVISKLEEKFGATDTLTLLFPASGAIQYQLKRLH